MTPLFDRLKAAGSEGLAYSLSDRKLPTIRQEITRLRRNGWTITEHPVADEGHSIQAGKRVRFVMEVV